MEFWQKEVYKDPRWEAVRQYVIKRDKDVCCFCGKIILKKRTIHHKVELSAENYKDPMIAFNPDNLVECHKYCHDIYHERFGSGQIVDAKLDIDYSKRDKRRYK